MRIALDATPLSIPTGGIRRYVEELTRTFLDDCSENEYWYFSDQPISNVPKGVRRCAAPESLIDRRWWLLGASRQAARLNIQVFHGTDFAVPYLPRCASVVTLHDLSPWLLPAAASSRVRSRTKSLLRLRIPTMVITPSDSVRREAIDFFGWPESRIVSVPLAPASWLAPSPDPCAGRSSEPPYFLYVGTLEERKNVTTIVEAWKQLPAGAARLRLAGRPRDGAPYLPAMPGLEILTSVTDSELAALYSNAAAVMYLSTYEGFGLPVLEAMRCGAPVIASNAAAVRETAGGAASIVDPRDVRAVAQAMSAILNDREHAQALRERGLKRAAEFSWQRTARETHVVYVEAFDRFRHGGKH